MSNGKKEKVFMPMPRRFLLCRAVSGEGGEEVVINVDSVASIATFGEGSVITLTGVPEKESIVSVRESVKDIRKAMTGYGMQVVRTFEKCPPEEEETEPAKPKQEKK